MLYRSGLIAAAAAVAFIAAPAMAAEDEAAFTFDAPSGVYEDEVKHRQITFRYDHLGFSAPWLRWSDWTGTLNWDADNPENSSVNVTINADSIDTGVEEFNGHLKGERFFDPANHPEITFVSTRVEATGDNTGKITGDLTIKDVTKPVTLDVVFNKGAFDQRENTHRLGFSAKTRVNRSDWGLDFAVPAIADEIKIVIETEWLRQTDSE